MFMIPIQCNAVWIRFLGRFQAPDRDGATSSLRRQFPTMCNKLSVNLSCRHWARARARACGRQVSVVSDSESNGYSEVLIVKKSDGGALRATLLLPIKLGKGK